MRSMWLALVFAFAFPTIGYSWTIEKSYQDPKFPGTLTVAVDPFGLMVSNQIDVLFVVDNSGSMSVHQDNLAKNIDGLIAPWLAADLDIHAGVISVDMDGAANPSKGLLYRGFATSSTPGLAQVLASNIKLGTGGSGTERHFDSVIAALSSPIKDNQNFGFMREHAALAIIFLTDAEDQSIATPAQFIEFVKNLKGGDLSLIKMGALYIPTGVKDCSRDITDGEPVKIEEALTAFNSINVGLCDANFKDGVEKLGLGLRPMVSGEPIRSVQLPMEAAFDTISVTYGSDILKAGNVSEGWIYTKSDKTITVGPEYNFLASPRGTMLMINYVPKEWQ